MSRGRIFAFHIKNEKNDYALAFRFVAKGYQALQDDPAYEEWTLKHVRKKSLTDETYQRGKVFRYSINAYEENDTSVPVTKTDSDRKFSDHDIFYFRVELEESNDILNLSYFLLVSKNCKRKCCLSIVTNDKNEPFKISHYLIYETLAFEGDKKFYFEKIGQKLKIGLDFPDSENIFLIKGSEKTCQSIHRRGLEISEKFFPFLRINEGLLRAFSNPSEDLRNKSLIKVDPNEDVENDLLYRIAQKETGFQDIVKEAQCYFGRKREYYSFPRVDLTEDILAEYCRKCIDSIQNKHKDIVKKYLSDHPSLGTISSLAFCVFLSFWSKHREEEVQPDLDAMLIDAQDFADGILQLLENVVKHVPGDLNSKGVFCFRIHTVKKGDKIFERLSSKNKELIGKRKRFFLEVLVSDFNEEKNILGKFKETINANSNVDDEELKEKFQRFELRDLFNYTKSKKEWHEFYKKPENLIFHYGLLIFDHIVTFAKGRFHIYSSKEHVLKSGSIYKNNEPLQQGDLFDETSQQRDLSDVDKDIIDEILFEEGGTQKPHIPGTQYRIILPLNIRSNKQVPTGLDSTFKITSEYLDWKVLRIEKSHYNILEDKNFSARYLVNSDNDENSIVDIKQDLIIKIKEILKKKIHAFSVNYKQKSFKPEIICVDVKNVSSLLAVEIFTKAVINLLFDRDCDIRHFSIINASDNFLSVFTRVFSLLYMKSWQSNSMINKRIYLCSKTAEEETEKEILFYGSSLRAALLATKAVMLEKGNWDKAYKIMRNEYRILQRECVKSESTLGEDVSNIDILPYAMLISDDQIFREKVKTRLERSVQKEGFGCHLEEAHMRIGSKIHIYGYYEASLLFNISNYISRFAYFLIDNIVKVVNNLEDKDKITKLIIVGYETYSESLIVNIREYLPNFLEQKDIKNIKKIEYLIYNENSDEEKFDRWNKVFPDEKKDEKKPLLDESSRFIIIVPIGSTLTTHDKIAAELCRKAYSKLNTVESKIKEKIILHHSVVLIRDDSGSEKDKLSIIEREFWESIDETDRKVVTRNEIGADSEVNFFVAVRSKWSLPDECEYCFPKPEDLLKEKPLIHSNRASVVPIIMYGLNEGNESLGDKKRDGEERLKSLQEALCYGHITRDNNHFQYYFQTDRVITTILEDKEPKGLYSLFDDWLKKIVQQINDKSKQPGGDTFFYDFIITPLHGTNANFVYEVDKKLQAKQIIWLDPKREYRDNVKAKHDHLNGIYNNLCSQEDINAVIRFHYVDDTINSGFSFYRAESLIRSLFKPEQLKGKGSARVRVELFSSVILLLNRCSFDTQSNYVDDPKQRFHKFLDLNVSGMRSHGDACVACSNSKAFKLLIPGRSATNAVALASLKKSKKFESRSAEKIVKDIDMILPTDAIRITKEKDNKVKSIEIKKMKKRNYSRLIMTHRLNNALSGLGRQKNDAKEVVAAVWSQLEEICSADFKNKDEAFEEVCDYFFSSLKVISLPFLSFRKSVSEAALQIILGVASYLLQSLQDNSRARESSCIKENSKEFIDYLVFSKPNTDKTLKIQFAKLLFSCLAGMRSTFLIRASTINHILGFCETLDDKKASEFIENYVFYVKQVLCLSGKNNLSVWLETLLLNEKEQVSLTNEEKESDRNNDVAGIIDTNKLYTKKLLRLLRLENTAPICDALRECDKALRHKNIDDSSDEFKKVVETTLGYYYCKNYIDFIKLLGISNYCSEFVPIQMLYTHLRKESNNKNREEEAEYYKELLERIKKVLDADDVRLYMYTSTGDDGKKKGALLFSRPTRFENDDLSKYVDSIDGSYIVESKKLNVGDTLFTNINDSNGSDPCFGVIRIIDSSDKKNQGCPVYYFAFAFRNSKEKQITEDDIIQKARNFLSMRMRLMVRLSKDFDNHIRGTLLDYQRLGVTDKSGSHAPFSELKEVFDKLVKNYKKSIEQPSRGVELDAIEFYAQQLKVIADSVISKWYVHHVMKTFPVEEPKPKDRDHYTSLLPSSTDSELLSTIMLAGRKSSYRVTAAPIRITWWICYPKNHYYIWYSAFVAVCSNILQHSVSKPCGSKPREASADYSFEIFNKDTTNAVTVTMLRFENEIKDDASYDYEDSVTLPALKYYFDHYYGPGLFNYAPFTKDGKSFFYVEIPCNPALEQPRDKEITSE